jgi:hypothetical protein
MWQSPRFTKLLVIGRANDASALRAHQPINNSPKVAVFRPKVNDSSFALTRFMLPISHANVLETASKVLPISIFLLQTEGRI